MLPRNHWLALQKTDCKTPVNINSEKLASPPSAPTVSTPNAVDKKSSFIDSANSFLLLAPVTVTAKNTDVDQVLADANISSPTSNLNAKIELLEKENVELRRIVINKEAIRQKLPSKKTYRKNTKKWRSGFFDLDTLDSFCEVLRNVQIHQNKTFIKKDSNQIDKNENKINKQLTEIHHNKHKTYLQSKNLERNKNQSNKEECQDVHYWPKRTVATIGDSMVLGLKEESLSNKGQSKM